MRKQNTGRWWIYFFDLVLLRRQPLDYEQRGQTISARKTVVNKLLLTLVFVIWVLENYQHCNRNSQWFIVTFLLLSKWFISKSVTTGECCRGWVTCSNTVCYGSSCILMSRISDDVQEAYNLIKDLEPTAPQVIGKLCHGT